MLNGRAEAHRDLESLSVGLNLITSNSNEIGIILDPSYIYNVKATSHPGTRSCRSAHITDGKNAKKKKKI